LSGTATVATPRFLDALTFAVTLHGRDLRKGSSIPDVAHLLSVCALVLRDGGTEDEAIAALLHDALEDHPEEVTRDTLAERFGPAVLAIVNACTDTPPDYAGGPTPAGRERKSRYRAHAKRLGPPERRVAMADKLDNARAILRDYREHGDRLWARFKTGREDQLWYYRGLVDAFRASGATGYLIDELDRVVSDIEALAR
jgi:GTP pyrophosphokinase